MDRCLPEDCSDLADGTECVEDDPVSGVLLLICAGGTCGGSVTDCSGVEDFIWCDAAGEPGLCIDEACALFSCDGLEDLTVCSTYAEDSAAVCLEERCSALDCSSITLGEPCVLDLDNKVQGFCEDGDCTDRVTSCEMVDNGTPCNAGDSPGVCINNACLPTDCTGLDDGTACWRDTPVDDTGICQGGVCVED